MSYVYLLSDRKGLYYVGKTSDIRKRITVHKSVIRHQGKCSSRYLDPDFTCDILEEYSNETDLAEGERKYYDIYREKYSDKLVNYQRPLRTQEEWYTENEDKIRERNKQYYTDNSEHYKQYRVDHVEEKTEYDKQYRAENADKIKARASLKHTCELCGGRYTHYNKNNHFRTLKHIDFIQHSGLC